MKSEWIPVTDRMPRNGQHVLFCGYDFEDDDTRFTMPDITVTKAGTRAGIPMSRFPAFVRPSRQNM